MRATLAATAALLVLALAPSAAAAATKDSPKRSGTARMKVLEPTDGERTSSRTLVVRLRVSTRADFRAAVAGNDVTRRFKRDGKLLVAKLRRGRDFRLGENYLIVGTGRGAARRSKTVVFVARRHLNPLLELSTSRTRNARTPLRVRLRVSHPVDRLRLTLNDRRVKLGSLGGRRTWVVGLGADDGLRFGRNSLSASAERTEAGHHDRERLRFRLDRTAPLVGAGPDRVTRSGRAVILDGGSTRPAGRRGLVYRWRIVDKPKRSRARIANSTAEVARLLPDLPGTYRVKLLAAPASDATLAAERKAAGASAAPAGQPTCLQPSAAGASAVRDNPLEAPVCVTPVGDATTPPLPLESRAAAAADVVEVFSSPTQSPMGWPIETIATDGTIRVGPQTFPKSGKASGWAQLVVLNQKSLLPESNNQLWGAGEQVFSLGEASKLAKAVEATSNRQITIISGMGRPQSQAPKSAEEALTKSVAALGGQTPPSSERAEIIRSGEWSVVGSRSEPGRTFTNLYGLTQQTPVEASAATLPGSLNGYLQKIPSDAFSFVSSEYVPIDTRAEGSSNTLSVFEVGTETIKSQTIGNGSLGLHIVAFATNEAGGLPKYAGSGTYVIDNPYSQTNMAGVKAAAEALERWADSPQDLLIVMQTFGEEAVGPNTAPWASPNWVNDALIHPGPHGLYEWKGQPYVAVKHESELEGKLDRFWNPGYPTVAGQVGNLTGSVGHDVVANLGAGNPGVEVTRLTMVANNRTNPSVNYARGFAGPAQGRLVGTLVRNAEGGWSVQSGVPSPAFSPEEMWRITYQEPTAWPLSEGRENKEAMVDIARELFGREATDVREEYVQRREDTWSQVLTKLEKRVNYEPTSAYTEATFKALKGQLILEIEHLLAINGAIDKWQEIFTNEKFSGFVRVGDIASTIAENAVEDARQREKAETEVNAEAIISESLYMAAEVVGFPEAYEEIKLAEMIGMVAGGFGLAEAASPEEADQAEGPNTAMIRARASKLGTALVKHFDETTDTLNHMETIYRSDWGKLKAAGEEALSSWAFSEEARNVLRQSLSVTTSQELYEGLLPVAYDQWVVSPYFTSSNPNGPVAPGTAYACPQYKPPWKSQETKHPFKDEPAGALSTAIYRPFDAPGSTTPPATGYTQPFTIRALKSVNNELEISRKEYAENRWAVTVTHDGSSPPEKMIEPLFKPINAGEIDPEFPESLGMSKVEFFAGFGGGPSDWRRVICAQE